MRTWNQQKYCVGAIDLVWKKSIKHKYLLTSIWQTINSHLVCYKQDEWANSFACSKALDSTRYVWSKWKILLKVDQSRRSKTT